MSEVRPHTALRWTSMRKLLNVMRKSSKKIYAAIIGIFIVLMILIFSFIHNERTPHFKLLKGKTPFIYVEESGRSVKTLYVYSFETDYNDFCTRASEELRKMDCEDTHLLSLIRPNAYFSTGNKHGYSTSVEFFRNYKLTEMSETYDSTMLDPLLHKELCCDGWVSIRVTKVKEQNHLIFEFKQLIQKLRGSH